MNILLLMLNLENRILPRREEGYVSPSRILRPTASLKDALVALATVLGLIEEPGFTNTLSNAELAFTILFARQARRK